MFELFNKKNILLLIGLLFLTPLAARASGSLGCESTTKIFGFYQSGYEGDGFMSLGDDFHVTYKGKVVDSGLFNWFRFDNQKISFSVYSWRSRTVHFNAQQENIQQQPQDGGTFYRISSGFVVVDGAEVDLKNIILECGVG